MDILTAIEILSAVAGLALSPLLYVFPRFGPASRMLVLFLVPASLSSAILTAGPLLNWSMEQSVVLSFACLVLSGASGCLASFLLQREEPLAHLKKHPWFFLAMFGAAPILLAGLYMLRPGSVKVAEDLDLVALGPAGFGAAVYLLIISVIALANVEQTLRTAEEYIRWQIKFLLLGLASVFASLIYVASQVLLYAPRYSILPSQAVHIFPIIFLCACLLIFQSWKRITGRVRITVSQGTIYSTITLLSVGIYLVASSLVTRWVSQWAHPSVPLEPILFVLSTIVLAAVLLGTEFRHRTKRWVRRNLFAGNYDYRQLWMDATEKVQSIESPTLAAGALAELISHALGSLDVSIWLQPHNTKVMRLIAVRGSVSNTLPQEQFGLTEALSNITEPVAIAELSEESRKKWPPHFLTQAKVSLVVPLISSGRLVGLITVGPDRTAGPFDREAREFLRVLAVHAASEFHKSELLESLVRTREAEAFRTFSTFLLHDLKNFASTLSLIAKNAGRHHDNPDFQVDAFRSILDTSEKMKHLCNSLRTFSSTIADNKRLDDLNEIVIEVANGFDAGLSKRLRLDLAPVPRIEIDRQEFARVLQNLILNANEASPDGLIEVSTRSDAKGSVICVGDKGKGIPKDFLEKELFQPFHTTKGDGLGIGLFQSKKIIESHDGRIDVESREGEGTVVRIVLPNIKPAEANIQEKTRVELTT